MAVENGQANGVDARPQPGGAGGRCVVLSPKRGAWLGLLLPALTGRWQTVGVVADEPGVMEELAGGDVSALVVVEPVRWSRLAQLTDAIGQYYREVVCMAYQVESGGTAPRIAALALPGVETTVVGGGREQGAPRVSKILGVPRVPAERGASASAVAEEIDADERLHGVRIPPAPPAAAPRTQGDPFEPAGLGLSPDKAKGEARTAPGGVSEPLVTEEELAMLLGPTGPGEVA